MGEGMILRSSSRKFNYSYKTYGIKIDTTISDPNNAVTYTDDAAGFEPLKITNGICNYGSWKNLINSFIGCKPCLIKDGKFIYYLNSDNYTKDVNGNTVDISSGNSGDVMIEFKHLWYKFSKDEDSIYFRISGFNRSSDGFVSTAFTDENLGNPISYFYYGAYEGFVDTNNKLRSLSGKNPSTSLSLSTSKTYAKNNGIRYGIESFF